MWRLLRATHQTATSRLDAAWAGAGSPRLRRKTVIHWIACLLAAWIPLQAHSASAWTLENDQLAVTLAERTGGVASVLRKSNGHLYTNPSALPEVLRLRIPVGLWDGHSAAGSQAPKIKVVRHAPGSVALRFGSFTTPAGQFPVEVEIDYRLEGDNLVAQLHLSNRGDRAIDRIVFPALDVSPAGSGDESIVMSSGPIPLKALFSENRVRTHHDPFQVLDPTDLRGWFTADPAYPAKGFDYPAGFSPLHTAWIELSGRWGLDQLGRS